MASRKRKGKGHSLTTSHSIPVTVARAVKILHIRSVHLMQQVLGYCALRGGTLEISTQLPQGGSGEGGGSRVRVEVEALACEWFVLAEASLQLSERTEEEWDRVGGVYDSGGRTGKVDYRVLQPLGDVVDKMDMFAELGLFLLPQAQAQAPAAAASGQSGVVTINEPAEEPAGLGWLDFVQLQEVRTLCCAALRCVLYHLLMPSQIVCFALLLKNIRLELM